MLLLKESEAPLVRIGLLLHFFAWNEVPALACSTKIGAGSKPNSRMRFTTFAAPSESIHRQGSPRKGGKPMPKMAPMSASTGERTTAS